MNAWFRNAAILVLATLAHATWAAPQRIETFDTHTWAAFQAQLKAPTAVVFTTTDCAHCPAVIDQLARSVRAQPLPTRGRGSSQPALVTVVMDQAPGDMDAALLSNPHYHPSQRLFAFQGQAPAIRYSVDPRWRGVTPYVVFLRPGEPTVAVVGPPSEQDVAQWLRRASGAHQ